MNRSMTHFFRSPCSRALASRSSFYAVLVLLLWSPLQRAYGQDDCTGWNSYNGHAYAAIDTWKYNPKNLQKWADKGDADAAHEYARGLQVGEFKFGTSKVGQFDGDAANAKAYFHKAEELGYKSRCGELAAGQNYLNGYKVKDETEGLYWVQKAIDHGSSSATRVLAEYYTQHPSAAPAGALKSLYLQSALAGDLTAQLHVADAYLRGSGVPADRSAADQWFQTAERQILAHPTLYRDGQEQSIADSYFSVGDNGTGMMYLTRAAQLPPYFDEGLQMYFPETLETIMKRLSDIYRQGTIVPQNLEYAQIYSNAIGDLQQLKAQQEQHNAEVQAQTEANTRAAIAQLYPGGSSSGGILNPTGATIQGSLQQQLARIASVQQRAALAQARPPANTPARPAAATTTTSSYVTPARTYTPPATASPAKTTPTAPAPAPKVDTCRAVTNGVSIESRWFSPQLNSHDPSNHEVEWFVTNNTSGTVSCQVAFWRNGQWVPDSGIGTYGSGRIHVGGQGGGSFVMDANSSSVRWVCYAGDMPTRPSGKFCSDDTNWGEPPAVGTLR